MATVNEKMTAIADAIREKTGETDALTLDDVAENIPKVYGAGKKAEYDEFWDSLQQNGERTSYAASFSGSVWTSETFKPKYPIRPSGSVSYMFLYTAISAPMECGVELDFSNCTDGSFFCYGSGIKRLGVINMVKATSLSYFLDAARNIESVEKLYVNEKCIYSYAFRNASALKNIIFEGKIGTALNMQYSPLTKASITSVINALSATTSGKTVSFKKTAVNTAFGSTEAQEWLDLVATKQNWTISLV